MHIVATVSLSLYHSAMSWEYKHDQLLDFLFPNPQPNAKYAIPAYPPALSLLSKSVTTSFDDMWDVLPTGRRKGIHATGVVCPFRLVDVVQNSSFTGMLGSSQEGATGLLRLGSAVGDVKKLTAGGAIKFLRTGVHSANFVTLVGLDGTPGIVIFASRWVRGIVLFASRWDPWYCYFRIQMGPVVLFFSYIQFPSIFRFACLNGAA